MDTSRAQPGNLTQSMQDKDLENSETKRPEEMVQELMAGLASIPVADLIECAKGNLLATRKTRLSKDHPEGVEEPDFTVRQKALEWISAVLGLSPTAQRKPVEAPAKDTGAGNGKLVRDRSAEGGRDAGAPRSKGAEPKCEIP